MTFLKFFSPVAAYRDLRVFLATRRRHELWFMALSLAITLLVIFVFFKDSHFEKPYERNIIYVEQWPITRTDDQIRAQQKIEWDAEKLRVTNAPEANRFVRREYRKGWADAIVA